MCELLLFTHSPDPHPDDDDVNAGQFRPGSVITIQDDGYAWGPIPWYAKLIKLPGIPERIASMLASALPAEIDHHGNETTHRQRHAWRARDWKALPGSITLLPEQFSAWVEANFALVEPMARKQPVRVAL